MALIELQGLDKIYKTGSHTVSAVEGITLSIDHGEFVALAGPSGSGKSTLLHLMGALDSPSSGRVVVNGVDLGTLSKSKRSEFRASQVGFIFQSYNLIPVLSSFENVELVLLSRQVPRERRKAMVREILGQVGLGELMQRRPTEMSGGQQQRVAVARAMVGKPALVLADEPTANLDSKTAEGLMALMHQLNEERGVTFIFATHDPRIMEHARRLIQLRDGHVELDERR